MENETNIVQENQSANMKFCKFCGKQINIDAVMCVHCGRQVEELKSSQPQQVQPQVVINNTNAITNTNTNAGMPQGVKPKNKWVALLLCFFLGFIGAHKFYEGKILLGIVYICTVGLLGIGILIDFIAILFKPNPYF